MHTTFLYESQHVHLTCTWWELFSVLFSSSNDIKCMSLICQFKACIFKRLLVCDTPTRTESFLNSSKAIYSTQLYSSAWPQYNSLNIVYSLLLLVMKYWNSSKTGVNLLHGSSNSSSQVASLQMQTISLLSSLLKLELLAVNSTVVTQIKLIVSHSPHPYPIIALSQVINLFTKVRIMHLAWDFTEYLQLKIKNQGFWKA